MPRTARLDIPDQLQHVIVRGVNRCTIFHDDHDRRRFLERLARLLADTRTDCLAWALMSNHVHLLLRPRQNSLAHIMRRLLTSYAIVFNRRHRRSGHLFQNRYKSLLCDENAYLLELVRYIHLNPLRAGLVADLDELERYPWSGHAAFMGQTTLVGQQVDEVLLLFTDDRAAARHAYRDFVADGIEMGQRAELVGQRAASVERDDGDFRDPRILGDAAFIQSLGEHPTMAPRLGTKLAVEEIVRRVCTHYAIEHGALKRRCRSAAAAEVRSVICYLAVREAGHSGVAVGRVVGLGRAGVSRAVERGEEKVAQNQTLQELVNK